MSTDFNTVTETPGIGATQEQLSMLYTRYRFASAYCDGKDVLEVACGSGQGLGYLARVAGRVVGGDIDAKNLRIAEHHYRDRKNIAVFQVDAHHLEFADKSFDVILLYEAIYYLDYPETFLKECRRLLRDSGVVLICTANREWPDFNPSPFSKRYPTAKELRTLLQNQGFQAEMMGAFPVSRQSLKDHAVSFAKRSAVVLHLVPKTMKGKQFLKRVFLGKLSPLPYEIEDGMADYRPPVSIQSDRTIPDYKVIFAVGHV